MFMVSLWNFGFEWLLALNACLSKDIYKEKTLLQEIQNIYFFSGPSAGQEGKKLRCLWSTTHSLNGSFLLGQTVFSFQELCSLLIPKILQVTKGSAYT